ncbi:unnamed protein product [Parajaminaea phylloscopi]
MAQIIRSPHKPVPDKASPGQNLASLIESNPNGAPDSKKAFIRASDGRAITRGQLFDASHAIAWSLHNHLKLSPGDRVAILSPNSIWYPVAIHADLLAGVVSVTLNAGYSVDELAHPFADSRPQYVFAAPALLPAVREALQKVGIPEVHPRSGQPTVWVLTDADQEAQGDRGEKDLRSLIKTAGKNRLAAVPIADPATEDAFIGYSSGTSGKPKGVQITHANHISLCLQYPTARFGEFDPDHAALAILPFFHIFQLFHSLVFDLYWSVAVHVMPRFELEPFLQAVERYRVQRLEVVPPVLVLLAKSPIVDRYDLTSLSIMLSGAAPLSAELGRQVEARLNRKRPDGKQGDARVCQGYGLTETTPCVHASNSRDYHKCAGSVGTLLPNLEARLVDEDGKDVGHLQGPEGRPGELWVRGASIMKGYLNRPDATAESIDPEGWFKTGDVAICPETPASHPSLRGTGYGEHFWIVDRKKELIKYKGFQVAPAEMEALLLEHPDVADAACIGIYDEEEATELPLAFIVPAANYTGAPAALEKNVRAWVDGRVAGHKKLRGGVRVREEIPKSPSGKILRRLLRDEIAQKTGKVETKAKL